MLRQDLSETINSISDIMMMVKMHSVSSPVERLKSWIYIIVMDYRYLTIPSICFIFYRTCLLLYKKGNHIANMVKKYCFIYCLGLLLFYSVRYGMVCGNAQVLLSILGLVALFSIEPWDRKMEVSAFLLIAGGIVSLCWHFASDTWDAFRIGFVISSLGAVFALCMFLENMNEWSEKSRIDWRTVTKAAICIVALCSFVSRFFYLYREENIWEQNTRITEGPAKGLYTTYEKERNYAEVLQASTEINELIELREDHTVYIDSSDIWEYLIYDAHCGGYTTWTTSINNPALKLYWEKHGYPDCVILANGSVSPITESMPDSPLYSKMLVENRIVYYKEQ